MIKPVVVGMRIVAVLGVALLSVVTVTVSGAAQLLTIVSKDILMPMTNGLVAAGTKLEAVGK